MPALLRGVFKLMPLWFGIGFIAPLTTQLITRTGWTGGSPASPIVIGLAVGVIWGGTTVVRGRWF